MGYVSQPALKNLKKYSYKGVDEWVLFQVFFCCHTELKK